MGPGSEDLKVEFSAKLGLDAQCQSAPRSPGREPRCSLGHTGALRPDCWARLALRTGGPAPREHSRGKEPLYGDARESVPERGRWAWGAKGDEEFAKELLRLVPPTPPPGNQGGRQ